MLDADGGANQARHLRAVAWCSATGRSTTQRKRSFPTPVSALGHFTGIGRQRDSGVLAAYRAPEVESGPVDAVNGAFMLIRRAALDEVGIFDEGYWMYMEDLDLCYRFAEAGWVTWYEPSATVVHVKAGSSGPVRSPRLNYAFHYGMFRFYRKHYAATKGALVSAIVYGGIAVKLLAVGGPKRDQASNPGRPSRTAPSDGAARMSRWRHRPGRPGASPNL